MTEHLPALQIILPLLAAPLCVLIRTPTVVRLFAVAVAFANLFVSAALLEQVLTVGEIAYHLGGWTPPLGIEYRIDASNAFVMLIVSGIAAVVMPFGLGSANLTVPPSKKYLFYAAFLLCITGLLGISITGDAFNIFVFLEVSSLSAYSLIALGNHRKALTAAFSYLIMGTIGGTFILIGIGLMYQMTGTLNIEDLSQRLPAVMETRTIHVAFAFITVGAGIKLAVFPLHQWLPNAYTYAPSVVSAFLAATATKVSFYVLARVIFGVFGAAFVFGVLNLDKLLIPLSIAAMFVGTTAAIYQTNVKRLLAYSSIAQIGYMTLGLSLNNELALTGSLVHLFNHALMKGGLFLAVACITFKINSSKIDDMAGLAKRMPWTYAAIVVGGLSLIGVPGTVGFISKWYLVLGALEGDHLLLTALILLSSVMAVAYVWRLVEVGYFRDPPEGSKVDEAPPSMLAPTWILIGLCVVFGLTTDLTAGIAQVAAETLMGAL